MYDFIHYAQFCFLGAGLLALLVGAHIEAQHIRDCPRIVGEAQLREFSGMVRLRMYLSLIVVMAVIPAVGLTFLERSGIDLMMRAGLLAPYLILALLGFHGRKMEQKLRDPERCDEKYQADFTKVCNSWSKRMLPDF